MSDRKPAPATVPTTRNGMDAMAQDRAAGGSEMRKMRTKSGGIVTVSLSVSQSNAGSRVILRFKSGGATVQRPVATVIATSQFQALKLGWALIREQNIVEKEGWAWVTRSGK